jgi:hypothetical protein
VRAFKHIESGQAMNKTRKTGWGYYGQRQLGQPERHHSSSGGLFLPDRLGGHDEEEEGDAGPSMHGSAAWRTRAVGKSAVVPGTMKLVGMLDLNVRVQADSRRPAHK